MDEWKLFAKGNANWEGLLQAEKNFSDYIGMDLTSMQKHHLIEEEWPSGLWPRGLRHWN